MNEPLFRLALNFGFYEGRKKPDIQEVKQTYASLHGNNNGSDTVLSFIGKPDGIEVILDYTGRGNGKEELPVVESSVAEAFDRLARLMKVYAPDVVQAEFGQAASFPISVGIKKLMENKFSEGYAAQVVVDQPHTGLFKMLARPAVKTGTQELQYDA